jgi:hypothetical protein
MRPQPCVQKKKHTSIVTTVTPETPGIPRAMVLTVSSALSPVTGLVCHRSPVKVAFHRLDASVGASGPHDFAVRRSAPSSEAPPASTASRPAFVTIASRPSKGTGPNRYNAASTGPSSEISEIPKMKVPSFRDGPRVRASAARCQAPDQTSDAQLCIGESRDSGFDALHRPGMTASNLLWRRFARSRWGNDPSDETYLFLFTGLRFSMNAAMPSERSSSAKVA